MLDIYTAFSKSNKITNPWDCYYINNFISRNEIDQILKNLFQIKPELNLTIEEKGNIFGIDGKWTYKPKELINDICPDIVSLFKNNVKVFSDFLNMPLSNKYNINFEFANLSPGFKYEIHNDSKKKKMSFVIYLTEDNLTQKEKEKMSTFLYNEDFDQITNISAEPGRLTFFTPISRKCFHNMENNTRNKNRFTMVINYMED